MKNQSARILMVDDDPSIREIFSLTFQSLGYQIDCHSDSITALKLIESNPSQYDIVLTDLKMPQMDGLELVKKIRAVSPNLPIVVITGHASIEVAVEAIHAGAYDFVVKPANLTQLQLLVERALRVGSLERENEILRREVSSSRPFEGVIGKSTSMQMVFDLARRVSQSVANVLITGESGTGKEVVARTIHAHGSRKEGPFIAINCSAIPENLLESELFGHSKGAFTGAADKKLGLFEEAQGGTLFLDEIGDMDLILQAKLLRVIQDRTIKRIGENRTRPVDVRIIAATHHDLYAAIEEKKFREDLYYRLCVIPIHIEPLRARTEDIIPLAQHFFEKYRTRNDSKLLGFTKAALERLTQLPWRGNVRELENVIERAVVLGQQDQIDVMDLPALPPAGPAHTIDTLLSHLSPSMGSSENLPSLDEFSQRYVQIVLNSVHGVKDKAARILKIDRKTLYRKSLQFEASAHEAPSHESSGESPHQPSDDTSDDGYGDSKQMNASGSSESASI